MARLWESGFETGTTEWNGAAIGETVLSTFKRTGNYSLRCRAARDALPGYFRQVFGDSETELYGRIALYVDSAASQIVWRFLDFRNSGNGRQFMLSYDGGTQTLSWLDGAGGLLAIGNVLIPSSTWVVIEFHIVVSASGSLTLKVNGTTDAVYSGDTDYTDVGNVRSLYIGSQPVDAPEAIRYIYIDDVAINNAAGSYQNSWISLGGVYWLPPTADTEQIDWGPSTGSDNYALVDEVPPNTTDYVQALDVGSMDLYDVADTPDYVDRINLLRVLYRAAVTTSGSNDVQDVIRVDGTVHDGDASTIVPLIPSFTLYTGPAWYLNPETAAEWAVAEVDALEAGFEIV